MHRHPSAGQTTTATTSPAEAEATGEGTEIRSQASEPETTQAVIPNDPNGINSAYDPIYDPKRLGAKKANAEIACVCNV